jgi:general secretion pathway protein J
VTPRHETLRMGTVLAQWEQDLQQVHDTALVPSLAFDGASLRLVRRQPNGLQIVTWSLREAKWQRWASPLAASAQGLQDAWLASQQLLGNEAGQLTLFEGLGGWQVYFYRNNAWTNAQSSGDLVAPNPAVVASAPVVTRSRLPDGVRVVLTLSGSGEGDIGRTITRDILVPPQLP